MSDDWLQITIAEAGYADSVVADVMRLVGTRSGRVLFDALGASGRRVTIEKPAVLDPPNAVVRRRDLHAATAGDRDGGSDCVIAYDPRQWPNPTQPAVPASDVLLFALFREALSHVRGRAALADDRAGEALAFGDDEIATYAKERTHG
jgi:hypothetical protein